MDVFTNKQGRFGIYVSGRWIGNVDTDKDESDVEKYFVDLYPNDAVVVWDNEV